MAIPMKVICRKMSKLASWKLIVLELVLNYQMTLCKAFIPTRNALDFKHASQ